MRIIQAIWPSVLLGVYTCFLWVEREWGIGLIAVALFAWTMFALLLDPSRKWTWWACLTPVGLSALAGVACFGSIAHLALFPDHPYWENANANQTGAIALFLGKVFLVPASLLLGHLWFIRRKFYGVAKDLRCACSERRQRGMVSVSAFLRPPSLNSKR